jgi:hypothetical protein
MESPLRLAVRKRANNQCEYCGLQQRQQPSVPFHIEHIVARQHGGKSLLENLALACHRCNLHKGTNLSGVDLETGQVTPLFDPRRDNWSDHFKVQDGMIIGLTATGRTTANLLQMNTQDRIELRRMFMDFEP